MYHKLFVTRDTNSEKSESHRRNHNSSDENNKSKNAIIILSLGLSRLENCTASLEY